MGSVTARDGGFALILAAGQGAMSKLYIIYINAYIYICMYVCMHDRVENESEYERERARERERGDKKTTTVRPAKERGG